MIRTARLTLRHPAPRDLPAFVAYFATGRSAWNGGPLTPGRAWRAFAAQLGAWQMNGFGTFAVTRTGDDRILGWVGPWFPGDWPEPEIGWSLFDRADEGQGLAAEAARAALDHAFGALGWTTAVSYIHPENRRSRALAERLGATVDAGAATPPADVTPLVYRHPAPMGAA